ncbi:TonB-dependent receptor [Paucihalobacter ruber]|uniref:TonB-dependent receptor n=1 Tax=Paucihalobacter ruber TaxID=2567861 RepID=A0A506PU62_9FLAO|nr:outer membrane beta-barrel family protein [Paucihalobacter ruber]TPV35770.1 TonB-dependent receptor [Paucihalobacter ruber]
MNRRVLLCMPLALLWSLTIWSTVNSKTFYKPASDGKGSVEGIVIDASHQVPLAYVTVVIENTLGEILTGGITDDKGYFKVNSLQEGNYRVKIQYIGFKTYQKDISISADAYSVNLDTITLEEDMTSLEEVTVVAEVSSIEQRVDRKVINVGKDLTTAGPTASDIMNNLPSVRVDEQSGELTFRGNQNVTVMVDGKLSNVPVAQLLKQIPSNAIKQIELITNPSAKYNPEGMSGIINIILHKNVAMGFNGSVDVGLAYQIEPKFNSALNLNYRNGKFNFYGNVSNNIAKNDNFGSINRTDEGVNQRFDLLNRNKSTLYKIGVDYYINDKNTLSVFTNQNIFDGGLIGDTFITGEANNLAEINQNLDINNNNDSQQYNLAYKLKLDKEDHTLEFEADHNRFDSDAFNVNTFNGFNTRPNFIEDIGVKREQSIFNLDYANPLSETKKLEAGLEARLLNSVTDYFSDARVQNIDGDFIPNATNYDLTRDIYSGYATFGNKIDKWTYQVGLRAENVRETGIAIETDLNTEIDNSLTFANNYFELYPSAFVTYAPSEKGTYQLSYSRRVDRPNPNQLNPLPEFTTPLVSQFGNPDLKPQFTNSLEANYTKQFEKGSITGGVFYRVIQDEINQYLFIDRDDLNRLIISFDNFDNSVSYGVEVSASLKPTAWWSINTGIDVFSRSQKSIAERLTVPTNEAGVDDIIRETVTVENVVFNARLFNNFKVTKKLSLSAFGLFRGPQDGVQFNSKAMGMVNLGMRYNFVENGTFSLNFNDIFGTMFSRFESDRPFRQVGNWNWESRTVFAGINYRFGGGKYRAMSRKQRDDNEAKSDGGMF